MLEHVNAMLMGVNSKQVCCEAKMMVLLHSGLLTSSLDDTMILFNLLATV